MDTRLFGSPNVGGVEIRIMNVGPAGDGGAEGNRTPDLLIANEALSQLSYSPAVRAGNTQAGWLSQAAARRCGQAARDAEAKWRRRREMASSSTSSRLQKAKRA